MSAPYWLVLLSVCVGCAKSYEVTFRPSDGRPVLQRTDYAMTTEEQWRGCRSSSERDHHLLEVNCPSQYRPYVTVTRWCVVPEGRRLIDVTAVVREDRDDLRTDCRIEKIK